MKYIDVNKFLTEIRKMINAHIQKQEDWLRAECHSLADEETTRACELLRVVELIYSLQQEQPTKGYDESYLNKCIAKASKTWENVDVDKYMDEVRGREQEQPEENKLPSKRIRVNYAICKLQAFKPLREAIVLDDYVYDEGKCYRENLINYIHVIPESRLSEIRSYLKEKGWWPYEDDADWVEQEQEQPEVDLEKEIDACWQNWLSPSNQKDIEGVLPKTEFAMYARHFYELGFNARKEEENE